MQRKNRKPIELDPELRALIDDSLAPDERTKLQLAVEEMQVKLNEANARARKAVERAAEAENLKNALFDLTAYDPRMPDWALERSEAKDSPHIPVLLTSDFQWGEVIDGDNMDGINTFNVEIAQQRYQLMIEKAIDIAFEHLPRNRYDGLVLLRAGDTVSGDIHEELRETNELAAIPATRSVVQAERWGTTKLADAFGNVHVISVPGNHGRYQRKPPTKHIEDNYDTLASWWLESLFEGDDRVSFQTPDSSDAVFEMHGRKYLVTHGDNIGSRGGQGFIGPAATIMRGMKKTMDEYARRGIALHKMFVGHFHTAYDLGYGWANGSLPGYSEFARANRMTPEAPIQYLLFFHPRYGVTSQWKLLLGPEPAGSTSVTPFEG